MGKGIHGQKKTIGAEEFSALLEDDSPQQGTAQKTISSDEFNDLFDEAPTQAIPVSQRNKSPQDITNQIFGTDVSGQPIAQKGFVDEVLNKHKNLEWVQRLYQDNPETVQIPGQKYPSTHFMAADEVDGKYYAYPTVQKVGGKLQYLGDKAFDYSLENNTAIPFGTKEEALWFAENGYKEGTGVKIGKPSPQDKLKKATTAIASDYMDNNPPATVDLSHPENPVNKVTNPTEDPAYLGSYVQQRIKSLDQDYNRKLYDIQTKFGAGSEVPVQQRALKQEYEAKKNYLIENAGHIVALQLFNKEYSQEKPTKEHTDITIETRKKQYESDLSNIDKKINATYNWEHPNGIDAVNERDNLKREKYNLEKDLQTEVSKTEQGQKYNPILLGAEYMAAFGDEAAKKDIELIRQGKSVSPARKYAYNLQGNRIVQEGTEASINENAFAEGQKHIDIGGQRLFENNKPFLVEQGKQAIGNKKYSEENPLIHALIPSQLLPNMSKEDVAKYGKEIGLDPQVIKEIQKDPGAVPKSASILQQFARGVMNTPAPLYEQIVRNVVRLSPHGDMEAVNEHFQPGWETQQGIGATIAGNTPGEQNSFTNVRGALGQIMEGAGGLATFVGEIGLAGKGLVKLGASAANAEKLANFGVMAFNGYNDAYHTSREVIGDAPEDESKRQIYSLINGLVSGAIFSINPKATLVKKALGLESKTGAKLIGEIQKSGGIEFLQSKEGKDAVTDYVQSFLKENGTQVGLATAAKVSEQIINTIVAPEKKQDIAEDIKNTAISTSLAMMLPSIGGAFTHTKGQTPLNSAAMFEVGTHPDQYINHVSDLLAEGKISPKDAQVSHDAILSMKNIIANTPTKNIEGEDLNPNQVKDYAYNMLQEHILNKQVTDIKKRAEAAKIEPDKAQIAPLNKKITELQGKRDAIMTGKPYKAVKKEESKEAIDDIDQEVYDFEGKRKGYLPEVMDKIEENPEAHVDKEIAYYQKEIRQEKEKPPKEQFDLDALEGQLKIFTDFKARYDKLKVENQGENEERSVATEAKPEKTEPTEKKPSEKVAKIEKENITLPSTESEQLKTEENGSIQNNEGRQSDSKISETEGSGQEANVRETTDSEGRQQQQEAGVLKEPTKEVKGEQEQPVAKQPEPTPEKKGPRQRRKLKPEQPEGVVREIPFEEKPVEDATKISKGEEQEGNRPSGEQQHQGVEPPRNEGEKQEADNRDQRISSPQEKEVAPSKISTKAQAIANKQIGEYNAVHGKKWSAQESILNSARRRVEQFEKLIEGSKKHNERLDQYHADKELLAHIEQKPPKRSNLNQAKRGENVTGRVMEKEEILKKQPSTVDEFVKQHLLSMDDKHPEDKFSTSSVEKDIAVRKTSAEHEWSKQFVHADGKNLDAWAEDIARDPSRWPEGVNLSDPQAIKEAVWEHLTNYESKEQLQKELGDIFHKREEDRIAAEKNWDDRADLNKESLDFILAKEEEVKAAQEENDRIAHDIADVINLPEKDIELLDEYLQHIAIDGKIDQDKLDPFTEEYQKAFQGMSQEGKKYLELLFKPETANELLKTIQNGKPKREQPQEVAGNEPEGPGTPIDARGLEPNVGEESAGEKPAGEAQAVEKPTPQTILERKQARLEKLQDERVALQQEHDEVEGHLNTAYLDQGDSEHIADLERELEVKFAALKEKELQIKKKQAEIEVQEKYTRGADAIRKFADKSDEPGNIFSTPTGISPHMVSEILRKVADLYESLGNVHIAAIRAAEWAKQQFKGAKGIGALTDAHVKDMFSPWVEPLAAEPVIKNADHLRVAEAWVKDILDGEITHDEAIIEVMDSDVSDKTKANVLNYIDWHLQGQDYHNSVTLREPAHENDYYDSYDMLHTNKETSYISEQTLKDITGQDVLEYEKAEALAVDNITKDAANIVGLAKNHYGDDLMQWGPGLLKDVKNSTEADPVKRVAALTGLAWELRAEKHRDPSKTLQVDKLLYQVEKEWKETLRTASKTLNAARANRLFRNEHYADMFAERILSDEQKKAKYAYENALNDEKRMTEVSQEYEKKGVMREAKEVEQVEKKKSEQKAKEEPTKQVDLFEEPKAPKKKSATEKIRDVFRKSKKDKRETKDKEYYAEKLKHTVEEIGGDPKKFMDELKNKIKSIKC
jgi:hypothetical protein